MSVEQNKALIRKNAEFINRRNLDAALASHSPNFVDHALRPPLPPGLEGVRTFFNMYFAAFPDIRATIEDVIAEGDKVVMRTTVRGTHKGAFMGIPPTGKQATWSFIDISRIADGKVVEHWVEVDSMALMQQLGMVPPPRTL